MNLRSAAATKLIGALALVVVLALGWLALVGPTLGQIGEVEESGAAVGDSNLLLTTQLAQLRSQAEDLGRTDAAAQELSGIFPATADQPGFFAQVSRAAARAGIPADQITTLSPGVPTLLVDEATATGTTDGDADPSTAETPAQDAAVDPAALAVQTVSITVTASYDQMTRLLSGLETMPRALRLGSVSIASGEGTTLTLTLDGGTFVAPPLVAPAETDSDPGTSPETTGAAGADKSADAPDEG